MKDYASFASEIALKAGVIMRNNFTLGMKKTFKDNDNSPLTISDIKINKLVTNAIQKEYPEHSILSEEGSFLKKSEYVWVCDPIDGTIPYSTGIPIATFSIALVKKGDPIMGVTYDPFMNRLYKTEKGKGAFLNENRISVAKHKTLQNKIVYIGWWKYSKYDLLMLRKLLTEKGCKILDFCSFVYAGSLVAAGEIDAIIFADKFAWDVAAIKILIERAGGKCTDINGNIQRYDKDVNGFIGSNKYVHDELVGMAQLAVKKN